MIPQEMLERLRYIEIYTAKAARDYRVGEYRSPLRGRGFEFDQHKRYQHGDDYRQIDWNVTARMQFPYVKKEFEEKETTVFIMADLSRSMEFSSVSQSKKELLLQIAATLAFSAHCDNMRVGLLGFSDAIEIDLPPKKGRSHLWKILEALWEIEGGLGGTDFSLALEHLENQLKRSAMLFCISDFIALEDIFTSRPFRHLVKKHDFIPLILEDRWEQAMPTGHGFLRLRDAESGEEMLVRLSEKQGRRYEALMRGRKTALQQSLYRMGLDHLFLKPGEPYLDAVMGLFLARKRRR